MEEQLQMKLITIINGTVSLPNSVAIYTLNGMPRPEPLHICSGGL